MRVVVTGLGIVSPVGKSVESFWNSLLSGRSGVSLIQDCILDNLKCKVAGQIHDFDSDTFLTRRESRRMDRFCQLAMSAAGQAWEDMTPPPLKNSFPSNSGVIFGTGIGGISSWDNPVSPGLDPDMNGFTIPRIMNNAASSQIAIKFNLQGINLTVNTACSSGANAIGMAFREIRSGISECIICGGSEASITPKILKAWEILKVLSKDNNPGAVKPFDEKRTGFALAEGAAVLILESFDSAIKNKRKIYAEITGFGSSCDAHHLTSPLQKGQADTMKLALKDAGIKPADIDYINAHGTATKLNDKIETKAIKEVFGKSSGTIPVSSTKSMTGHAMGASSAMEMVATILSVKNNRVHPTVNLKNPDPECDLDYVPEKAREKRITHAMSNSFGFGGSNVSIVVKKWKI
jgi:3-oxoacyl-[acyl-carrier-protein] synthase II